jgi:hypothetical protein
MAPISAGDWAGIVEATATVAAFGAVTVSMSRDQAARRDDDAARVQASAVELMAATSAVTTALDTHRAVWKGRIVRVGEPAAIQQTLAPRFERLTAASIAVSLSRDEALTKASWTLYDATVAVGNAYSASTRQREQADADLKDAIRVFRDATVAHGARKRRRWRLGRPRS